MGMRKIMRAAAVRLPGPSHAYRGSQTVLCIIKARRPVRRSIDSKRFVEIEAAPDLHISKAATRPGGNRFGFLRHHKLRLRFTHKFLAGTGIQPDRIFEIVHQSDIADPDPCGTLQ